MTLILTWIESLHQTRHGTSRKTRRASRSVSDRCPGRPRGRVWAVAVGWVDGGCTA
jgi:hypothetical protein